MLTGCVLGFGVDCGTQSLIVLTRLSVAPVRVGWRRVDDEHVLEELEGVVTETQACCRTRSEQERGNGGGTPASAFMHMMGLVRLRDESVFNERSHEERKAATGYIERGRAQ